jgi:hypothetical protein
LAWAKGWDRTCTCVGGDGGEGVGRRGGQFRYRLQDVRGVRSRASEVLTYHILELLQGRRLDIQFPIQVLAHLPLHLINLPQLEHPLPNYTPRLVRICVVTDYLRCDHEGGDEESVARRTASCWKSRFESLEENEGCESDRSVELRSMECVGDEMGEFRIRAR